METLLKKYYASCLRSDIPSAIRLLANSPRTEKEEIFFSKVKSRFLLEEQNFRIKCDSELVKAVIKIYRSYYRAALLTSKRLKEFERELFRNLRAVAREFEIKIQSSASDKQVEIILAKEFKKQGYNSIFGTVKPFRSLLVWGSETTKKYKISLPEREQSVKVVFMDQFVELGWLHFATFGKYYVGGWAKKSALFCVRQAYRVDSPKFLSHYLAHEAQHFSDYRSFPKLNQTDLEYRAKLAEIYTTSRPRKFLAKLKSEEKNDVQLPHCFAAYKILMGMANLSAGSFKEKALVLLKTHSQKLKEKGAQSVRSVL